MGASIGAARSACTLAFGWLARKGLTLRPGSHQEGEQVLGTTGRGPPPVAAANAEPAFPCTSCAAAQLSIHAGVAYRPSRYSLEGLHLQQVGAQRLCPPLGLRVLQQTHGQLALTQQHCVRIVHLQSQGSRGSGPGVHTAALGSIDRLQVNGTVLCQSAWQWHGLTGQTATPAENAITTACGP